MLPKIKDSNKIILQDKNVLSKLNEIDLLIAEKGINVSISELSKIRSANMLTEMSKNILKDVGIKEADIYEIGRFVDLCLKYYKTLSLNEIKLAFELLLIGELDNFLPKDKNGQADKNHYQSFSAEYITRVLKAYKKRKDKTWLKAYSALPKKEDWVPDENEKRESRKRFIEDIKKVFNNYKATGEKTDIHIPAYWVYFLHKQGFIKEPPILNKNTIEDIYKRIIGNDVFIDATERKHIEKDFKKNEIHPSLLRKAQYQYYYDLIYRFFDYVIKKNEDLNKLL